MQEAFKRSKQLVLSSQVYVHYDPMLPLVLSFDASLALSLRIPDGEDKAITFSVLY